VKKVTLKKRAQLVLDQLDEVYGKFYVCYLNYSSTYELLFATMLSAQCTDERVNTVTKDLFKKYTSLEDFAKVDLQEIEKDIHSTGFYHNKAKNIKACANVLIDRYQGEIIPDIDLLVELPGVGRKTANVVLGHIFHKPGIVVDTHVKRISGKLGFTNSEDPVKIEYELMKLLPEEHWLRFNTQIIAHGRTICTARSPKCETCFLLAYCPGGLREQLNLVED
jgi:endonuclease III